MHIHQAISFRGDAGVEVLIEATHIQETLPDHVIARFTYSAALGGDNPELTLVSEGLLKISFGEPSTSLFPERQETPIDMVPVEHSRLYNHMDSLGYNFTGPFRSLMDNKRKLGRAACVTQRANASDRDAVLVHAVDLDAMFQAISLAYSYPGDGRLRNLHLPTTISKIRVNQAVFESAEDRDTMVMDSILNPENTEKPGSRFTGNTDVYLTGCSNAAVQVDQVIFKVLRGDANDDRKIFCTMDYVLSAPDGHVAASDIQITDDEMNLLWALSRIVHFYTKTFDEMVPADSPARLESLLRHYLRFCRHVDTLFEQGKLSFNLMRDVRKPFSLDGHMVPPGAMLHVPTLVAHYDEDAWGVKGHAASEFWGYRHIRYTYEKKFEVSGVNTKPKGQLSLSGRGGTHICPGRFYAKKQIMLTIASFVSEFDMEFVRWTKFDGSNSDRAPKNETAACGTGGMPPDRDTEIKIKRRLKD
ncbi:polyketide synthase dehydratase-domain-containing protein [Pseudomassariella vexata]|uniref:Polyketide synthase dehydratase-domain-containing protein n=1 Tax=Pseudomassariella vexata TaxID=1141098 RepID=A0A1Y2EHD1_9PEZI|nr:polyketide synthase dehydratase-domain-containing protein [Pseudomassariella vexata]ORY70968.1 polyketide synthase dehydratase-domain-containing protein [Pseudomassariella vexata]